MDQSFRSLLSTTCLTAALLYVASAPTVVANPVDGTVVGGNATIGSTGSTLNVTQTTNRAVIDWRGFDIGAGETTNFFQPSNAAIAVNRVTTGGASRIDGALNATGNVVIINQNGVMFGGGAKVDVNGLVATTSDINTDTFMGGGKLQFITPGNPNATVSNAGMITVKEAGLVGFVAPNVVNSGIINARLGRVHLASGDTSVVDFYGDGLMDVAVSDAVTSQLVANTGAITADGGTIALTAAAGSTIVNSLITNSGALRAQAVGSKNGEIIIAAEGSHAVAGNDAAAKDKKSGSSTVLVAGTLDVSGTKAGERGGKITITGDKIAIAASKATVQAAMLATGNAAAIAAVEAQQAADAAAVDAAIASGMAAPVDAATLITADGTTGGGVIHIGGDYLGKATTPTALYTIVQTGTIITANATGTGSLAAPAHGGEVILYADTRTEFGGSIRVNGGSDQGDGGFVETSGKLALLSYGQVTAIAGRNGKAGTWLMDPADITITRVIRTLRVTRILRQRVPAVALARHRL